MASRSARRSIPRPLRIGLWSVAGLLGLVVVALGVFLASFDPDSLKPRIVEAVRQATGRDLALNGHIRLGASLQPTLVVEDVAFANPPGFSRPQMATLERLDLKLALLPLLSHRVEINRLVLVRPDILLETDKQGRPNWVFARTEAAPSRPSTPAATPKETPRTQIAIAEVRIDRGTITYRDATTGSSTVLGLSSLKASAAGPDANLRLTSEASYNGTAFTINGDIGPVTRLLDAAADTPWPVRMAVASGEATLTVEGTLTKPTQGHGYRLKIVGSVPDLAALSPLLPGQTLPPLRDVQVSAQIADTGGPLPDISSLTLHVGNSDLSGTVAGLRLGKLDIEAARFDQPVKASAQGTLTNMPLTLAAALGAPASLLPGAKPAGPFPVDVSLQAAGSTLALKGAIADPQHLSGVNLAVTANVADLGALSPLARRPLPSLASIAFQAELREAGGGLANGVALHGLKLSMPQADVTGDVALDLTRPPLLRANLKSSRIDADALLAVLGKPLVAPGAADGAPSTPPAAPPAPKSARLIPDTRIRFDLLRTGDADVTFGGAELRYGGALYHAVALHAVLRDGKLQVEPFSATLPEGHLSAALVVDATQAPAAVALRLQAPDVAVAPLLAALGQPGYASGKLEVYANLHGAGDTPHAIAASVGGTLGLAMANGTVDNRLLGSTLGAILREINLLDLVGRGGSSQVQCLASRLELNLGIGTFRTLLLSSNLLTMEGGGGINLGAETLDLRVRPQARIAATSIVVPLRVTGAMRSPSVAPDPSAAVAANAGTVAGAVLGGTNPLGLLAGALGGDKVVKQVFGGGSVDCAAALAVARGPQGEAASPQPVAQPAPSQAAPNAPGPRAGAKPANPGNLLRQLFR